MGLTLACAATFGTPARADDLADEAELLFRLATDHYQRREYVAALKDFLASNRLVQNGNVVFNIARTYERLAQYPESYRYYLQAAEDEPDSQVKARIEAALAQLRPRIAVLDIETQPPGATLFVNRRDLGPRGQSPRQLGLAPGEYLIMAELAGHQPTQIQVGKVKAGQRVRVLLNLEPLLGTVRVTSPVTPLAVQVDGQGAPKSCLSPCDFPLPPGRHSLVFLSLGRKEAKAVVDVEANRTSEINPELERVTGVLVVRTDEPGALVEADGKTLGFTPLIQRLPLGKHRIRVSSPGFRPIEHLVETQASAEAKLDLQLAHVEEVIAASRVAQSVSDAPASVTLLPQRELRALAYPTLADALRGVRGIFVWNDRAYASVGIRGPGFLGTYGNRLLVLSDGTPLNDDWIGSSYVGYDGRADLGDVERIEVVRGPGSVVYGTNAISGVVNLVSRSRNVPPGVEMTVATEGELVARARGRVTLRFGKDSGAWLSVAGATARGADLYFPEMVNLAQPGQDGWARGLDGFQVATLQGRAWYKWLSLQWFGNSHDKKLATAPFDTLFRDARAHQQDQRGLLELRAEPQFSRKLQLLSRVHFDQYKFLGAYPRTLGTEGGVQTDTYNGIWMGLEERLVYTPSPGLLVTVGGEGQLHGVVEQETKDQSLPPRRARLPFQVGAAYALLDARASAKVRVSAGARLDADSRFGVALNPRIAIILHPYRSGILKIIGGRAFRVPSTYELYYDDGGVTQKANPRLTPEVAYSTEVEHSHELSPAVALTGAVFANYTRDLILIHGAGRRDDPLTYENSAFPLLTVGAEAVIRRDWRQGWTASVSYGYQHSTYLQDDSANSIFTMTSSPLFRHVANQPEHILSLKAVAPLIGRGLLLGTRLTAEGPRWDRDQQVADSEARQQTDPLVLWDVVLSGEQPRFGIHWAIGMYNAFDWRYSAPVGREYTQRFISQPGRNLLASLSLSF